MLPARAPNTRQHSPLKQPELHHNFAMCDNTNTTTQSIADYLSQLLKDRKQLAAFPNVFIHVERLLDEGE